MSGSEVHGAGFVDDLVGVWMERPVVHERYEHTRRYPESLMPVSGVRVDGFTVALDVELTGDPEAASDARRLFEKVSDAIEFVVRGGQLDDVAIGSGNDDEAHAGEPTDGEVAA